MSKRELFLFPFSPLLRLFLLDTHCPQGEHLTTGVVTSWVFTSSEILVRATYSWVIGWPMSSCAALSFETLCLKYAKPINSYSSFSTHFGNHPFCKALPESFRFSWLPIWVCHITLESPIITFSSWPYIAFLLICLLHQIASLWRAGALSLYSSFYPQNLAQVPGHSRCSVNMYWMND